MRNLQGSITYFSCLLTKDRTKKSLLCGQLCLSFRSNLADKNIIGTNLSTDTDDTSLIQILQCIVTNARHIAGNLLCTQLGISCLGIVLADVYRSINVFLNQSLT